MPPIVIGFIKRIVRSLQATRNEWEPLFSFCARSGVSEQPDDIMMHELCQSLHRAERDVLLSAFDLRNVLRRSPKNLRDLSLRKAGFKPSRAKIHAERDP